MALTPEQQELVITRLNERIKGQFRCPASNDSNWAVQDHLSRIPATDNLNVNVLGGPTYPCVVVICNTCGYTALFNLYTLGLGEEFGLSPAE